MPKGNGDQMGRALNVDTPDANQGAIQGERLPITPDSASGLDTQESGPRSAGRMRGRQTGNYQRDPQKNTGSKPNPANQRADY